MQRAGVRRRNDRRHGQRGCLRNPDRRNRALEDSLRAQTSAEAGLGEVADETGETGKGVGENGKCDVCPELFGEGAGEGSGREHEEGKGMFMRLCFWVGLGSFIFFT